MRFFAIAAAFLSFTGVFASPAPLDSTDLAARAEGDLEARTFWKCSLLDKLKCKKKGERFQYNEHTCHCEEVGELHVPLAHRSMTSGTARKSMKVHHG